jgi:hypothetical protein
MVQWDSILLLADEVARCVRDGKLQSDVWSLETSLVQMSVFDEVRLLEYCPRPPSDTCIS